MDGLGPRYEHDIALVEGDWDSLRELQARVKELNVIYGSPIQNSPSRKVYDMIKAHFDKPGLGMLAATLYDPDPENPHKDIDGCTYSIISHLLPRQQVLDFLASEGIEFLAYPITIGPGGIFHDSSRYGGHTSNPKKIASVAFRDISKKED